MYESFAEDVAAAASVMPDLVHEVMAFIREKRFSFVRQDKVGLDGDVDIVTDIDREAQRMYRSRLALLTPHFGMIGEEDGLSVKCRYEGHDVYWTNDPIDGTEAFGRRQSHGVGTMLALVADGAVVAACIGDICTGERYSYGPDDGGAWRIDSSGSRMALGLYPARPLSEHLVLLGQRPELYSKATQHMIGLRANGGLFKYMEIDKGSIGIRMARLWKGEVGAVVLKARHETPWDDTPLVGFCKKLGFKFLKQDGSGRFEEFAPKLVESPRKVAHETLIVHESRLGDLRQWEQESRT